MINKMKFNIRLVYLYLFSVVGLVVTVIGSVRLVDLGLKVLVFQGADRYEYYSPPITATPEGEKFDFREQQIIQDRETIRQRQRQLSESIAMIVVGAPLYLYHWKTVQKENREKKNNG